MSPMSSKRNVTIAHLVVALIFMTGVGIRLFDLGARPLADFEAQAALSALPGGTGGDAASYAVLTGWIMRVIGNTNFAARLLSALAGGSLALLPFLLRKRFGTLPALFFAAGLALDPLLVNVSRQAGGPMLAAGLLAALIVLRMAGEGEEPVSAVWPGIFAGLALLSGSAVFFGLLSLLFTYAALKAFGADAESFSGDVNQEVGFDLRRGAGAFAFTVLLVGTGFMLSPQRLGSFAASIPAFLLGWVAPSGVSAGTVIFVFLSYQLIPLILALIFAFRSWRSGPAYGRFLSIWFVSSFLLVLIYPGRQTTDLVWVSMPMWGLAAGEIGRSAYWRTTPVYKPLTLAAALVVFLVSFWTNLTSLSYVVPEDKQFFLRLMIIAGTLILAGLSISLVNLGWDRKAASAGTVWGIGIILVFGMLAGIWGMAARNAVGLRDPLQFAPAAGEVEMFEETLLSLGDWYNGSSRELDIMYSVDSPALVWALRSFPDARPGMPIPGDELPEVVITTKDQPELRLASAYRGQSLIWRVYPAWEEMGLLEWGRWILFREAPVFNERIIVWVRADLFLSFSGEENVDLFPLDALDEQNSNEDFVPLEDPNEILPGQ